LGLPALHRQKAKSCTTCATIPGKNTTSLPIPRAATLKMLRRRWLDARSDLE
jgi:hypothetical protein